MAWVPPHTAGQTCASHFPALYSFTFFSRKTSSLCISMVTLQFSLYLYFLGYLSLLILKHILVIGAVKQYFHSSNTSQSHETFLDTQVLPVSVSVQVYISAHCSRDHIIGSQLRRSSLLLQELDKDQLTTTVSASRRDGCTFLDLPRTTPLPAALY